MDAPLFEQLHKEELVSEQAVAAVKAHEQNKLISVHWDLRLMLYFGVLLFSTGLGLLLYKHVDTIGHVTLVTLAGLLSAGCFAYCLKKAPPYSNARVESPNVWFDYILLLGCLLMLAFVGYLQFMYHVFGTQWGLALFIPMLLLFVIAYSFDHLGVLSLAVTNLGAWLGVAVAPLQLMNALTRDDGAIILNGVGLGVLLHVLCVLSVRANIKAHFSFVYKNFGVHILFISLIAGMVNYDHYYLLWWLVLMVVAVYRVVRSVTQSSFYYLVASVLYGYLGLSYVVVRLLFKMGINGSGPVYTMLLYFIASGIALVMLLIHFNRLIKRKNDSV